MRTFMLGRADFRILMAAMTFFGLLVVLLLPEGCFDPSLMLDRFPVPIPE